MCWNVHDYLYWMSARDFLTNVLTLSTFQHFPGWVSAQSRAAHVPFGGQIAGTWYWNRTERRANRRTGTGTDENAFRSFRSRSERRSNAFTAWIPEIMFFSHSCITFLHPKHSSNIFQSYSIDNLWSPVYKLLSWKPLKFLLCRQISHFVRTLQKLNCFEVSWSNRSASDGPNEPRRRKETFWGCRRCRDCEIVLRDSR